MKRWRQPLLLLVAVTRLRLVVDCHRGLVVEAPLQPGDLVRREAPSSSGHVLETHGIQAIVVSAAMSGGIDLADDDLVGLLDRICGSVRKGSGLHRRNVCWRWVQQVLG
jgi:hypothetical protein